MGGVAARPTGSSLWQCTVNKKLHKWQQIVKAAGLVRYLSNPELKATMFPVSGDESLRPFMCSARLRGSPRDSPSDAPLRHSHLQM